MLSNIYRYFWTALDWLYPPILEGRKQTRYRWCKENQINTQIIRPPFCGLCGQLTSNSKLCFQCAEAPLTITCIRSWTIFKGERRKTVHKPNCRKKISLGEALSSQLVQLVKEIGWNVQLVIPVPLSVERQKARRLSSRSIS